MAIWVYGDSTDEHRATDDVCRFCSAPLKVISDTIERPSEPTKDNLNYTQFVLNVCDACGWWQAVKKVILDLPGHAYYSFTENIHVASAVLKGLDLSNISIPIDVIRDYLCAKYTDRFNLHPRLFEETVASVFRDFGFETEVTAYSGDDGIDVILRNESEQIGVQVKRYKDKIAVDQIRELAGALVLNGLTKGIFVTTSTFQSGGESTSARFAEKGFPIELIDAPRFFDALRIAQRNRYTTIDDFDVDQKKMKFLMVSSQAQY
jgi:restriction system protein